MSLAERALKIVVENSNPKISLAPLRLSRCTKTLYNSVKVCNIDTLDKYTTVLKSERVIENAGLLITQGEVDDAMYLNVSPVLPESLGTHGVSYTILQPFALEMNEEQNEIIISTHRKTMFVCRTYLFGNVHGYSIRLVTENNGTTPGEICIHQYEHGEKVSNFARMKNVEHAQGRVYIEVESMDGETRSGEVSASYCTRAWRNICQDDTETIWELYNLYMTSHDAVINLFGMSIVDVFINWNTYNNAL